MRDISRKTDILMHPESLPQQAMASIAQMSLDTPQPSSLNSRSAPESARRQALPSTNFCQPAASTHQPTTHLHQLVDRHTSATTRSSARSRSPRAHMKAPTSFVPATSGHATSQHPATSSSVSLPKTFVPMTAKHSSGRHSATSIVISRTKDFVPLTTMLATSQHPVTSVSTGSPKNFVMATTMPAPDLQPITNISSHFVNITPLGAGMGKTSLVAARPTTVMTPSTSVSNISDHPTSSVISLVTGTHCHVYDFDIADPLPDLPDVAVPSPQPSISCSSPFTSISLLTPIEAFPHPSGNSGCSQPTTTILTASHSNFIAQSAASLAEPSANKAFPPCLTSWS